jgi:hypothetical protein
MEGNTMTNRAERAKRRMSIVTTVLISVGVVGLAILVVVMHT